jgi:hypothetical protein
MSTKKYCDACREEITDPMTAVVVRAESVVRHVGMHDCDYDFHPNCWQRMLNIGRVET